MSIRDLIANAETVKRAEWLNQAGTHTLMLKEYGTKTYERAGQKVVAVFVVVESAAYDKGSTVSYSWDVYNNTPAYQKNAARDAKTFLCALIGESDISTGDIEQIENGCCTGTLIKAKGVTQPPRERKDGNGMTKEFVQIYFNHVDGQTNDDIMTRRNEISPEDVTPEEVQAPPPPAKKTGGLLASLQK